MVVSTKQIQPSSRFFMIVATKQIHLSRTFSQLYKSAHLSQLHEIIAASQACISDAQAWMHNNKLQLNADKTEMILIASKYNQKSQPLPSSVDLTGTQIYFSTTVRNL